MSRSTYGSRFERIALGLAVVLAPLVFSFQELTYPAEGESPAQELAHGAAQYNLWLADIYLGLAAGVLFILVSVAVVRIAQPRGAVLARVGAALTVLGVCVAILPKVGLQLMLWAMAGPGVDQAAMAGFLRGAEQNPAGAPLFIAQNFFALGVVILGVAVWRSGFGYRWAGLVAAAGIVLDVALGMAGFEDSPASGMAVGIVSDLLLCVGLAAIGIRLIVIGEPAERAAASAAITRAAANEA